MRQLLSYHKRVYQQKMLAYRRDNKGSIAVETAFVVSLIIFMAVGVMDFGLAYNRSMELTNAVRAGMQYATVRKPISGDMAPIESAVNQSIPYNSDVSNQSVIVTMYCQCPDGTSNPCTSFGGGDITCDDGSTKYTFLSIAIKEDYDLMLGFPGIGDTVTLNRSAVIRLN